MTFCQLFWKSTSLLFQKQDLNKIQVKQYISYFHLIEQYLQCSKFLNIQIKRLNIVSFFQKHKKVQLSQEILKVATKTSKIDFSNCFQITFQQIIQYRCKIIQININYFDFSGGGFYDDQGYFKKGKWIELSDKFDYYSQVTYKGQYKNNKKIGSWVILWNWKDINQQIGNGLYDDQVEGDSSIKVGIWIEQSDEFDRWSQIVNKGEYKNGRKIGKWVEINIKQNIICGELNYDN
ncbi:unnamed protein product [Paramecium primaurelia]|uniref:Uncharacterized protein n=1 Tax=Paramecium primaurelia TaxID=5886 RepID=A0A8S1NY41_PARPR|nr:unnamed protein product [Paramecium primaurelia]